MKHKLILKVGKKTTSLKDKKQFKGYRQDKKGLKGVLLINNGLHVELIINPYAFHANNDPIGLSDLVIESAVSTIIDKQNTLKTFFILSISLKLLFVFQRYSFFTNF